MAAVYLLWDESFLWGLLAWRALAAFGVPYQLVRGQDIAQGLLLSKPPALLVAPGGVARRKAALLGPEGMASIRDYIASGGAYLGFCGGSGLGLTGRHGLGLCPWTRAAMTDRMLHLVSGHVRVTLGHGECLKTTPEAADECGCAPFADLIPPSFLEITKPEDAPLLPVWWPARFAAEPSNHVGVLASYAEPGEDFWIADLPLSHLPHGAFAGWEEAYGVRLRPDFMREQPCMAAGRFGHGRYVLSYAHLETPASPHANLWLAHLLTVLAGCEVQTTRTPPWNLSSAGPGEPPPVAWDHPLLGKAEITLRELLNLGRDHFLLFDRNDWLLGWRAGIPGAHLNHLWALVCTARSLPATPAAAKALDAAAPRFDAALDAFREQATHYLMAERLSMTLARAFPDAVSAEALKRRRSALFGEAMEYGGLYGELLTAMDEVMWRQLCSGCA